MASCVNFLQVAERRPTANGDYLRQGHLCLQTREFIQIWSSPANFPTNSFGQQRFNFLGHFEYVKDAFYADDPPDVHDPKRSSIMVRWRRNVLKVFRAKLSPDLINKFVPSLGEMLQLTNALWRHPNGSCRCPTK